jgi:DNA-binding MarR family transcriptional regulator
MQAGKTYVANTFVDDLKIARTTLRRTMDRLVNFDLVNETADPKNHKRSLFHITKNGVALVKAHQSTQEAQEAPIQEAPAVDLVAWLREQAAAFLAMADALEKEATKSKNC